MLTQADTFDDGLMACQCERCREVLQERSTTSERLMDDEVKGPSSGAHQDDQT